MDGFFLIGLEKLQTVSLLMSSHFPKKVVSCSSSFFLSPTPYGWVVSMIAKLSWSAFLLWERSHGSCVPGIGSGASKGVRGS
jgi:hypothetical protein